MSDVRLSSYWPAIPSYCRLPFMKRTQWALGRERRKWVENCIWENFHIYGLHWFWTFTQMHIVTKVLESATPMAHLLRAWTSYPIIMPRHWTADGSESFSMPQLVATAVKVNKNSCLSGAQFSVRQACNWEVYWKTMRSKELQQIVLFLSLALFNNSQMCWPSTQLWRIGHLGVVKWHWGKPVIWCCCFPIISKHPLWALAYQVVVMSSSPSLLQVLANHRCKPLYDVDPLLDTTIVNILFFPYFLPSFFFWETFKGI